MVENEVKNVILSFFRNEVIKENDDLFELNVMDSVGVLELVAYIEKYVDIGFEQEDLRQENFQTVAKILALIERKYRG